MYIDDEKWGCTNKGRKIYIKQNWKRNQLCSYIYIKQINNLQIKDTLTIQETPQIGQDIKN